MRMRPVSSREVRGCTLMELKRMERGTEASLDEWEPELWLVRPEVLPEELSPALKDIKAAG